MTDQTRPSMSTPSKALLWIIAVLFVSLYCFTIIDAKVSQLRQEDQFRAFTERSLNIAERQQKIIEVLQKQIDDLKRDLEEMKK